GNASISGDDLTWDAGTLEAGETRSVSYTVTVDENAHGVSFGNVIVGGGSVPPDECPEVVPQAADDDDDGDPCQTTHETLPKWTMSKSSDPASGSEVAPGDTVTYTVEAVNTSGADVEDVFIFDDLDFVLSNA